MLRNVLRGMQLRQSAITVALTLFCIAGAQAAIIGPGGIPGSNFPDTFSLTGATLNTLGPNGGLISGSFTSTTGRFSGSYITAVYTDPNNATTAACVTSKNCLDFVYQVSNNAGSVDSLETFTASGLLGGAGFAPFFTDAGFATAGPSGGGFNTGTGLIQPQFTSRIPGGGTVGFLFGGSTLTIGAGKTSAVLVIETNATNFALGTVNVIDGSTTTCGPTPQCATQAFVPAVPTGGVPEPASVALLGVGLVALAGIRRFCRR